MCWNNLRITCKFHEIPSGRIITHIKSHQFSFHCWLQWETGWSEGTFQPFLERKVNLIGIRHLHTILDYVPINGSLQIKQDDASVHIFRIEPPSIGLLWKDCDEGNASHPEFLRNLYMSNAVQIMFDINVESLRMLMQSCNHAYSRIDTTTTTTADHIMIKIHENTITTWRRHDLSGPKGSEEIKLPHKSRTQKLRRCDC